MAKRKGVQTRSTRSQHPSWAEQERKGAARHAARSVAANKAAETRRKKKAEANKETAEEAQPVTPDRTEPSYEEEPPPRPTPKRRRTAQAQGMHSPHVVPQQQESGAADAAAVASAASPATQATEPAKEQDAEAARAASDLAAEYAAAAPAQEAPQKGVGAPGTSAQDPAAEPLPAPAAHSTKASEGGLLGAAASSGLGALPAEEAARGGAETLQEAANFAAAGASAVETTLETAAEGFAQGWHDVLAMPAHGVQEAVGHAAELGREAASAAARAAAPGVSKLLAEEGGKA